MAYFKQFIVFLAAVGCYGSMDGKEPAKTMPGTLGDPTVKVVKIRDTEFYFYMTPEKSQAIKDLVKSVDNKELLIIVDRYDDPYTTVEFSAISSILPEGDGTLIDPVGNSVMDDYASKVIRIAKEELNIEIEAASREINLIVSQDAHKFHQDQFKRQYEYLATHHGSLPKCKIIHDLTLVDWNMSKGTVSGTLFQDDGGDRLLVTLFPNEAVGIITAEAPVYPEDGQPPVFPGSTSLPFHAVLSPVDFHGSLTSGSSKGQRISTVVRGIVREDSLTDIRKKAIDITPYRPVHETDEAGLKTIKYENGIVLKHLPNKPPIDITWNCRFPDQENIEILKTVAQTHTSLIKTLQTTFGLNKCNAADVQVRHLIKRDGGFSKIDLMDLEFSGPCDIVLINSSSLPEDGKYFNVCEDLTNDGYPWIHLYQFNPDMAVLMDEKAFRRLSLTPIEELIYRDEVIDNTQTDGVKLFAKPVTRIDVFIFPKSQ